MTSRDIDQELSPAFTQVIAAKTASGNGTTVDLAVNGGHQAALIVALPGTITDGTHALVVQESDDDSSWSTVDSGDLSGAFGNLASDTIQKVAYLGLKRYLRVNRTVAGATTGGIYGVAIIRGQARNLPVA